MTTGVVTPDARGPDDGGGRQIATYLRENDKGDSAITGWDQHAPPVLHGGSRVAFVQPPQVIIVE